MNLRDDEANITTKNGIELKLTGTSQNCMEIEIDIALIWWKINVVLYR